MHGLSLFYFLTLKTIIYVFLEKFKMNEIFDVTIFDILHIFKFQKNCFHCIMHSPNGVEHSKSRWDLREIQNTTPSPTSSI